MHSYALDRIVEVPRARGRKFSPFPHSAEGETFGGRTNRLDISWCKPKDALRDLFKCRAWLKLHVCQVFAQEFLASLGSGKANMQFLGKTMTAQDTRIDVFAVIRRT